MVVAARAASQVMVHMSVAFLIMYAFTGSVAFGGLAAILEPICVVGILPLHDRLWAMIEGRIALREQRAAVARAADIDARRVLAVHP